MRHSESLASFAAALTNVQRSGDPHEEGRLLARLHRSHAATFRSASDATTPKAKFLANVVCGSHECWFWCGSLNEGGYGRCYLLGEGLAHRVSWTMFEAPIPKGAHVLHRCDVRNCVNPEHLFIGSHSDNMVDMYAKGRRKTLGPQADAMREMRASGATFEKIGAAFDCSISCASRRTNGQRSK